MSDFRYDPGQNSNPNNVDAQIPTYLKWIYGGVAAALVIGLLTFAFNNERSQTASNQQPGVTAPAETTGSGAARRPTTPAKQQ